MRAKMVRVRCDDLVGLLRRALVVLAGSIGGSTFLIALVLRPSPALLRLRFYRPFRRDDYRGRHRCKSTMATWQGKAMFRTMSEVIHSGVEGIDARLIRWESTAAATRNNVASWR